MANFFTDYSFELDDSSWGAFGGGVVTQSTEEASHGTHSAKVVTGTDFDGLFCNTPTGLGWAEATPITATGRVKAASGELEFYIQRLNQDASSDNVELLNVTCDGTWKYFSISTEVAAGKTLHRASLLIVHNPGYVGAITFYVDPVLIEDSATPSALPQNAPYARIRSQFELRPY